jgi:hypothetical protein
MLDHLDQAEASVKQLLAALQRDKSDKVVTSQTF